MSVTRCVCRHGVTSHIRGCCQECECGSFQIAADQTPPPDVPDVDPQTVLLERIAVALESIANLLDAMRRDG